MEILLVVFLHGIAGFDQSLGIFGKSGPTTEEYQNGQPTCGRPRFYHKWNLFFELPDERRRRSGLEKKSEFGATTPPTRTHGANGLSWLEQSKKDLRKKERLEQKGKGGDNTYKDTQRLIGGDTAIPHSWPWQAFVKIEGKAGGYDCGGSIIDERWIVTAAHCVPYRPVPQRSYVYVGLHRIHSEQKTKLAVKRVIVHENYGHPILDNNDIALIELVKPLKFSEKVQPICLPDSDVCLPTGTKCAATGWGVTDKFATQIPDELNEVGVKIIEKDICENIHSDYKNQLSPEMLCAGYKEGGKDACLGDSGGPLACQVGGHSGPWMLYGITSWGIGCGDPLHPGVYTRVTKLQQWISSTTGVAPSVSSGDFDLTCNGQAGAQTTTSSVQPTTSQAAPDAKPDETPDEPKQPLKPQNQKPADGNDLLGNGMQTLSYGQSVIDADLKQVESCGGRTNEKSGNLRTPGYGKKVPAGVTCLWQIDPGAGNNSYVEVEFKRNDVGNCKVKGFDTISNQMPSDYVVMLDAQGKIINRNICRTSNKSPLKVYSKSAASIMLHSDNSGNNGKGFRLRFRTIDFEPSGCGDPKKFVLASNNPTHIASMNWPNKYAAGITCGWEIFAPLGHVILVEVTDFWIGGGSSPGCASAFLAITDSDGTSMARICGKLSPNTLHAHYYQTTGRKLMVNFDAGRAEVKRGFRIKLRAVPLDEASKSVRTLGGDKVSLQSNYDIIERIERLLNVLKARLNYPS